MNKQQAVPVFTKHFVNLKKKYFEEIVMPVFNEINQAISPVIKTYNIAGKIVCLKFYSKVFAESLSLALSHNEINTTDSTDLTIYLWDSASTKSSFASPWISSDYYFADENKKNNMSDSFFGIYLVGEDTLSFYDKTSNSAYFWTSDTDELPDWITGAPVRTILHWFLPETNTHLIHGAVIGLKDQAILLTAKGGSGKSTTALSCLLSGMNYLADDYAGIELSDEIITHSLYNSVKLDPCHLNAFPELHEKVWNKDNLEKEKAIIFLAELFPGQIISNAKLKAIMIPVIKNTEKTQIVPAGKMQAMLAMIPTSIIQLPLGETNKIEALKALIARMPCYFLELGVNIKEIPGIIKSFLNDNDVES